MSSSPDPATPEGQMVMQRSAEARTFAVCRTFNEIQSGPNPLTRDEISAMVEKRPKLYYNVLRAWTEGRNGV